MRKLDEYLVTIDTMYPDGYARESQFRSAGDMLSPSPRSISESGIRGWIEAVWNWHCRRRSRAALRELDDAMLRDIGLTRQQADEEVRKSTFFI